MLVKKGEVKVGQGKGFDVVEGGKVVQDCCESIRDDPCELVILGKGQRTNVMIGLPQASSEPQLEVGEGLQLEVGEEVVVAPIDPAGRDERTREKTLFVCDKHVDYFLDDLLGKMQCDHREVGRQGRG